jgi:outer membrane protein assembly factor BamB
MRVARTTLFALTAFLALAASALAADWPQYRGPNHDGKTPEAIRTDWPAAGPKVLWKAHLGDGSFGTFAVAGNNALVLTSRGREEGLLCLDANSGQQKWYTPLGRTIEDRQGGDGPRTTPTVVGDKVYALGTYFNLVCLGVADGKQVWAHDLAKEFNAQNDTNGIVQWGNAGSPIVEGDLVMVAGGGGQGQAFLAFDKASGKLVWKSGTERITHATGTPATIHGVRQVVFFVQSGLVSVDAKSGRELWRYKFPFNVSTASAPVVGGENGDIVYCSAAYNMGSGACRVTKSGDSFDAKEIWRLKGNENANHWTTPVCHEGYLYGLYGHRGKGQAKLECRELASGKVMWSEPAVASGGATTMAAGKLIVQHEDGKLVIVETNPAGYKKLAEAQPLKGKAWSMAVVSNGRMFVRTDKDAACLDVAVERSADAR